MGQVNGSATPQPTVTAFINLPKEAILGLWLSYNLLGEGWALTADQFVSIFKESSFLQSHYALSDDQLARLFATFDTDNNGLIDALEMLVTIGLLSGMDALDKVNFAFSAFDFEGKNSLSRDETNLLFRSVIKGLQKIASTSSGFSEALPSDGAKFADLVFEANGREKWYGRINVGEFQEYCVSHPVISSWLKAVAAFDEKDRIVDAAVKDPDARNEWISALDQIFALRNADERRARRHVLSPEDILLDLANEAKEAERNSIDHLAQPWVEKVQLLKPEELPAPQRWDLPEDAVEYSWLAGVNGRRVALPGHVHSFEEDHIHHSVRYRNTESDAILFSAGSNMVVMKKNEETSQWSQEIANAHNAAISCFDLHYNKDLLITAEISLPDVSQRESHLVLWKLSTLTVRKRIRCPYGVKFINLNANGNLAVVVYEDTLSTLAVINLDSGLVVFTKQLLLNNSLEDRVTDVSFFGTASLIAVSSIKLGLRFFVNEEAGVMGKDNMQLYEERNPIFGALGKEVKHASILSLTRLDAIDELVCATASGQLIVWRGRTVAQVIESVHNGPILSLDFNQSTKTLVTGGQDGSVKIFDVVVHADGGPGKKGPKPVPTRSLLCAASFDILRHPIPQHAIGALSLNNDGSRLLVVTSSCDILEVRSKIAPPTEAELEEAAEAPEGEDGVPASKAQLGDDLHGGSIIAAHFLGETNIANGSLPVVICGCKLPSGGFVTSGSDNTFRLWQLVGDGETSNAYKAAKTIAVECPASALAATSSTLAIALECPAQSPRTGTIQFYAVPDGTVSGEITDIKQAIRLLTLSSEGNLLVAACEGGDVHVLALNEGVWASKGILSLGMTPASLDLSSDNQFLRCFLKEPKDLKVFDINANFGKEQFAIIQDLMANAPQPAPPSGEDEEEAENAEPPVNPAAGMIEALKALTWNSNNCPYGFDTVGVRAAYDCVRYYDRSNALLLSSLEDGCVNISRAPSFALASRLQQRSLPAHVGPLSALFFIEEGGAKMVTVGQVDNIIRIWKVTYDTDEPEPDLPDPVPEEGEEPPPAEEGEEGKPVLPKIYDSGEEDDLLDLAAMKKHLNLLSSSAAAIAMTEEVIESSEKEVQEES
eukprot:gene7222-7988_t